MIRVLNIISDSNIGGAGKCVLTFLKFFDRKHFAAKVVVPRGSLLKKEIEKLGIKVIECDGIAEKSLSIEGINNLGKIIIRTNPDIVHTHGTMSGRIAAKMCRKKIVYTRHSVFDVSPKISRGIGKIINGKVNEFFSDRIIAVAEAAKDNLIQSGISEKKITVVLNGVEQLERCNKFEKEASYSRFGVTEKDYVVSIMARLESYKGHKYLLEAVKILKDDGIPIKAIIAGTGNYENELKAYAAELCIEKETVFAGFVSDIKSLLAITDVQANASYGTEATSLSLLEGMSLGIPAVVSNFGGNPGVITDNENGMIFESKNSAQLAKKLEALYKDKEKYDCMSKRAVEIFNEKFTAKVYAKNIEDIYASVLEGEKTDGKKKA
ncbi:MAG: glycosyltransferase family 4 protein [Clostridia bacterium]|jgi:glycosyltransferase involved in cell wall biosynthesis|nr:glycosyltransferase family 4 protein [Clostridia bacterium]MCI2001040.1 glycosyltransferase family 4 protein [Clostridia bacterium]MCI2015639.1 glycosyltransferase family 4 protein [Clostridia bacterium]